MNIPVVNTKKLRISRIATLIIFLALIRCITEVFRLEYYSSVTITYLEIKPFIIGSLVTAIALFIMTILSFFEKYKFIIAISILTIIVLLVIKRFYLR